MVDAGEALVEVAVGRLDRRAGVDVAGSAEAPRDFAKRHAVEPKLALLANERAHGAGAVGLGGSGSLSGPFWPHAPIATSMAAKRRARIMPGIMTESEFHRSVDAALARIDAALADSDVDVDLEGGILTITCPDDSRIIVNRQTPNREIWVAARSGGFHFAHRDGAWHDTRSGDELFASLARLIAAQAGVDVGFD